MDTSTDSKAMRSDARDIIDAVERLHEPTDLGPLEGVGDLIAVPKGMAIVDTKPFHDLRRDRPERREGTAKMTTLDAFISYVARFADADTSIFAIDDPTAPKLLAVFDHHEQGPAGKPRFGRHRCVYEFPLDDAWKAWRATEKQALTQAALAQLLEDRIGDVMDPSSIAEVAKVTGKPSTILTLAEQLGMRLAGPSTMLTISRGISVRADVRITQALNTSDGTTRLSFEESHTTADKAGGALEVPGLFAVAIPVFRFGDVYQIAVRLRYRRTDGGGVAWSLALHRADLVFADAFRTACEKVSASSTGKLYFGTPEA